MATTEGMASQLVWLVILQCLTGDAASWTDENAFEADFCTSDDKEAAIAELAKLCKVSHKLR